MLNTRKLIYLLPEVCFVAELLPGKKPHSFAIQSFRQINGQFMKEEDIVTENVLKLFNKLDPETYTLILPDFLFTNTIVDVNEASEEGVRNYLLTKLLPSLGLTKETHQLETFILTQHQNKTKVQLSGLEKSILSPAYDIATERKVVIETICPLSWTLKSLISLEPSLSAVELGKHVYLAQHYIGVDQSVFFSTEELGNIVETVRTLRGAEPNLQTLYLLTGRETEAQLKDQLKQRLPLQQLAEEDTSIEGLPAHVKTAIEAAAKTLDIEDYPVPKFSLEKYEGTDEVIAPVAVLPEKADTVDLTAKPFSLDDVISSKPETLPPPKPHIIQEAIEDSPSPMAVPSLPTATTPISVVASVAPINPAPVLSPEPEAPSTPVTASSIDLDNTQFVDKDTVETSTEVNALASNEDSAWSSDREELDPSNDRVGVIENKAAQATLPSVRQRPILKNRNSSGSLFKMVGITLGALLVTVVVGVSIGFALLKMSEKDAPVNQGLTPSPQASTVVQATASPATSSSPSASVAPATTDKAKMRILVVNATGVSGLAGKVKTTLTQAGYKLVDTGNAKGKYDAGNYILAKSGNAAVVSQLITDSKLTATAGDQDIAIEDAKATYDAVIVLNQN
jgi:hypothetical protein